MKSRLLSTLALSAALLLPVSAAMAQDEDADASTSPEAATTADVENLEELGAMVPPALAGLPLHENLVLVSGEEFMSLLPDTEAALFTEMLEDNGKTTDDYAGAFTYLNVTDSDVVVIQAHQVAGVQASDLMDDWVAILTADLEDPVVNEGYVAGRSSTFIRDDAAPEVPALQLIPAMETMWMMVAADQALVEEFVESLDLESEDAS